MVTDKTYEIFADKTAAAIELLTHIELDASSDYAAWSQVIRDLHLLSQTISSATETAVKAARENKLTWEQIGQALDMSRQAAWERFGGTL